MQRSNLNLNFETIYHVVMFVDELRERPAVVQEDRIGVMPEYPVIPSGSGFPLGFPLDGVKRWD